MDVSLRQWPLFVTGLLLGAAGTMSLGLHRPTQAELAAAAQGAPPATTSLAAVSTPPVTVVQAAPVTDERTVEQMGAVAEAFRAQEAAVAVAAAPFAVALAQPQKPRVRRLVQEAETEAIPTRSATGSPVAIAPTVTPELSEPVARAGSATSVMGGAPEGREDRPPLD